jgi:hypothetical protein
MNPSTIFDILGQAPNLAGALCKGRADIFELPPTTAPDYTREVAVAVKVCHRCPVLPKCERYLERMPSTDRPVGMVFAARVVPKHTGRGRNRADSSAEPRTSSTGIDTIGEEQPYGICP